MMRKLIVYAKDQSGRQTKRESLKWHAIFVDYSEAVRRLPLLEDRRASVEAARKVKLLNEARAVGERSAGLVYRAAVARDEGNGNGQLDRAGKKSYRESH
jgi:hypothetical protein